MELDYSTIDPVLLAGMADMPPGVEDLTRDSVVAVREARADFFQPEVGSAVTAVERTVGRESGDIRVIVYGAPDDTTRPGLLWIHGGGYVIGTAEDDRARLIAEEVGCRVVSVDYRLAPEHPFPAGVEDCHAALLWMAENSSDLAIDPDRIAIGGQSGGGGLAAGLALWNRDRGGPRPVLQLLLYPMIDNLHDTPSGRIVNHPVWNRETSLRAWEMYLDGTPGHEASGYAAATRARDLADLPPAYICVGTADLFRDEDIDYARRLLDAGVPTELAVFPGIYHGSDLFVPDAAVSRRLRHSFLRALADAFDQTDGADSPTGPIDTEEP
ncbi:MAG: alpha/beta hydrolase [Acidimicrobiales bacterium]